MSDDSKVTFMKIMNIMLSRNLGGIEQSFVDYSNMLGMAKLQAINIASFFAPINSMVEIHHKLPNFGNWDYLSIKMLQFIISKEKPDAIIAHGGRATKFALKARKNNIPIIGIIHSDKLKWVEDCDHIFALTKSMMKKAIDSNIDKSKISLLPNCVNTSLSKIVKKEEFSTPPIIGTMARFVPKKGIDTLLESLSILRGEGIQFKAIIGGDGKEAEYYKSLAHNLGLGHYVEFPGWIKDKEEFFNKIDLFCLPSHNEPFGIILLEAMSYAKPIISTSAKGPSEILENDKDSILVEIANNKAMADAIVSLIHNEGAAEKLGDEAIKKVKEKYDINIISKALSKELTKIVIK